MSAAVLREAAARLREVVEAASGGPWQTDGPFWVDPPGYRDGASAETRSGVTDRWRELVAPGAWETRDANMEFIAMMDPLVAGMLADWLDDFANTAVKWTDYITAEKMRQDHPALLLALKVLGRGAGAARAASESPSPEEGA